MSTNDTFSCNVKDLIYFNWLIKTLISAVKITRIIMKIKIKTMIVITKS